MKNRPVIVALKHIEDLKKASQRVEASFEPSTWDEETNSIEVTWYTGAEVKRRSWEEGEFYMSFDMQGADLSRYNSGAGVFRDHMTYTDAQVGKIMEGSAKIEKGMGKARVQFSRDPASAGFVGDVKAGIRKLLSMGTAIGTFVYLSKKGVADADKTRVLVTQWTPHELSFVGVPADAGAQTLSDDQENRTMDPEQLAALELKARNDGIAEGKRLAAEADRLEVERKEAIETMRRFFIGGGGDAKFIDALVADKACSADQARTKVTTELARIEALTAIRTERPHVTKDNDGDAGKALVYAMALKMGAKRETLALLCDQDNPEKVRQHKDLLSRANGLKHGLNIARLAERELVKLGKRVDQLNSDEVFDRYMRQFSKRSADAIGLWEDSYDRDTMLGEVTTDALPVIAAGAQRIMILAGHAEAPATYDAWTKRIEMEDHRPISAVDYSKFPSFREIGESGKPEYGSIVESSTTMGLKDYGRQIGMSRRLLSMSRFDVMGDVAKSIGYRLRVLKNRLCYALLCGTPAVGGTNVYDGDRLIATAAPSIALLDLMDIAIRNCELLSAEAADGVEPDLLNLPMVRVVIPLKLRTKYDQLLGANASTYVPGGGGDRTGNLGPKPSWMNTVVPVVDNEIDRLSGVVAHYGFCDPTINPAFAVTELAGEVMRVQMIEDPETLGVKLIAHASFDVTAVNVNGTCKVAGS